VASSSSLTMVAWNASESEVFGIGQKVVLLISYAKQTFFCSRMMKIYINHPKMHTNIGSKPQVSSLHI
jgi:hypothetical protein